MKYWKNEKIYKKAILFLLKISSYVQCHPASLENTISVLKFIMDFKFFYFEFWKFYYLTTRKKNSNKNSSDLYVNFWWFWNSIFVINYILFYIFV